VPTAPTTWDCLTTATYDAALTNFPDPLTSSEGWIGDGQAATPYALRVGTGAHDNGAALGGSTGLLSGLSAFSIDAWFKSDATPSATYPRIIDKSTGATTGWAMMLNSSNGNLGCELKASGATYYDSWLMIQDYRNVLTYACMTYSDTDDTLRMYVNGSATTASTVLAGGGTVTVGTGSACIGNRTSDYARGWGGWISTVRIYNKQLNTTEIQANYDAGILATTYSPATTSDCSFLLARGIGIA
jgi:hypothetical protein